MCGASKPRYTPPPVPVPQAAVRVASRSRKAQNVSGNKGNRRGARADFANTNTLLTTLQDVGGVNTTGRKSLLGQ
ncbi:MAG: hypothetical protein JKY49_15130 [Cohaesibacteraceae bacterium]|nr:hypothetical protein [Cohaesibacteraceae bacterium]MBL4876382.1 hypothetical protein [Cohaesibacteraceae bacterium]